MYTHNVPRLRVSLLTAKLVKLMCAKIVNFLFEIFCFLRLSASGRKGILDTVFWAEGVRKVGFGLTPYHWRRSKHIRAILPLSFSANQKITDCHVDQSSALKLLLFNTTSIIWDLIIYESTNLTCYT